MNVFIEILRDFWSPLAYSIMFGLTFAMVLTLIMVPTLYYRAELKKQNKRLAAEGTTLLSS